MLPSTWQNFAAISRGTSEISHCKKNKQIIINSCKTYGLLTIVPGGLIHLPAFGDIRLTDAISKQRGTWFTDDPQHIKSGLCGCFSALTNQHTWTSSAIKPPETLTINRKNTCINKTITTKRNYDGMKCKLIHRNKELRAHNINEPWQTSFKVLVAITALSGNSFQQFTTWRWNGLASRVLMVWQTANFLLLPLVWVLCD